MHIKLVNLQCVRTRTQFEAKVYEKKNHFHFCIVNNAHTNQKVTEAITFGSSSAFTESRGISSAAVAAYDTFYFIHSFSFFAYFCSFHFHFVFFSASFSSLNAHQHRCQFALFFSSSSSSHSLSKEIILIKKNR